MALKRQGKKTSCTEYRKQIMFRSNEITRNDDGSISTTPVLRGPYWSAIYPLSAKRIFEYKSMHIDATHIIKVNGKVEFDEDEDIIYGERVFEILTIEDIQERGIEKLVVCLEKR